MSEPTTKPTRVRKPRRMAREPKGSPIDAAAPAVTTDAVPSNDAPARMTKARLLLDLLQRNEGATLAQLVEATGWLPHTTRAALTGLKKKGHAVSSDKVDGVRIYRVTTAGAAA